MSIPLFFVGLVLLIVCIWLLIAYMRKINPEGNPENRGLNLVIFILSSISLVISVRLFWIMGVYADEYGSSPVLVCGGWFWLVMDWVRLGLLLVLCIISGFGLIRSSKKDGEQKPF
jgi:hypothetical protein